MSKCEGWCGLCYSNRKGRTNRRGHWGYRFFSRVGPVGSFYMRRGQYGKKVKEEGEPRPPASGYFVDLPRLWEFIAWRQYEDGEKRVPGSVSLFWQDGGFKVCLSDKDSGSVAFIWGPDPVETLFAAEAALEGGTLDWRASQPPPKKR